MKIATYNIWTSDRGMPARENHIIAELNALDSDIIAIQEVKNKAMNERLLQGTDYKYYSFAPHEGNVLSDEPDRQNEGLAVYSKHTITYSKYIDYALIVVVEHMGKTISLANLHLPYHSVLAKEACIVSTLKEISALSSDYQFILGDFNSNETSSVHQYLKAQISLYGTEVKAYWTDLAYVAEEFLGVKREMTLDLSNNPRWKGQSLTDNSSRVDCIFIHDCFPLAYPKLRDFRYFGKDIDENTGLCASDHYGVFAELEMPYEEGK